MNILWYIYFTI